MSFNTGIGLLDREVENFVHAVETSLEVRKRNHFFLWARGPLQSLIPHRLMVCVMRNPHTHGWWIDCISAEPFGDESMAPFKMPEEGLFNRIIDEWRSGMRPLLACPSVNGFSFRLFGGALQSLGFGNLAAHGQLDTNGEVKSYFAFIDVAPGLDLHKAYLLELLTPYLQSTLSRVLLHEKEAGGHFVAMPLTTRELEILRWIQRGKSNSEIGKALALSPLTVKNHVQQILRKLNVSNRTHAVVVALNNRMIPRTSE